MSNTKTCEHCGKGINMIYMTCPLCGGRQQEEIETVDAACPRCRNPLTVSSGRDEEYNICPSCGGMWLDRAQFHLATTEYDVYRKESFDTEYRKKPPQDPLQYLPCIRCGKLMNRKNFGRISGVMIDECGRHGVWLDSGELVKIRHFIADGGLERAQDKEIEKNRVKIEEVASDVKETAFVQKILHFWNFKRWLFGGR